MDRKERQEFDWKFHGFETATGNRPVADWIKFECPEDGRDELVDILVYMRVRPHSEWDGKHFKPLNDGISEIRFNSSDKILRIYGYFGPTWFVQSYVFLVANEKKVKNDRDAKKLARSRRDEIERRRSGFHPFVVR